GLADDNGFALQLRERRDKGEGGVDGAKLIGDARLHVAVHEFRRALGVEGDEVKRRALLSGGVVGPTQAVLQKVPEKRTATPRGVRAAHPRGGQRPAYGVDGVIV